MVKAATDVTVGGLVLHRETGDGLAGDSQNANKTFVDANIQINPPNATNEVGSPHVLTGHVNVNAGTGFVNAPAGTTINFTESERPGQFERGELFDGAGDRELLGDVDLVDAGEHGRERGDRCDRRRLGLASGDR